VHPEFFVGWGGGRCPEPGTIYSFCLILKTVITRRAVYVKCNMEALSHNHCSHGNAISIKCYECVCSHRYPACSAHAPYYIVICSLFSCAIFLHIVSYTAFFRKKKVIGHMCFDSVLIQ